MHNSMKRQAAGFILFDTCICSLLPAVMLEIVQQASFLMLFLWLWVNKLSRQGSAPCSIIHYIDKIIIYNNHKLFGSKKVRIQTITVAKT